MPGRIFTNIGVALVAVSAAGLLLATGNLISLPSIQTQLIEVLPNAKAAVEEAAAQSRRKTYYGVVVCAPICLLGVFMILSQRKRHSLDR